MTEPGPEGLGGSSHHKVKRSVITVNEPNQLVGAVPASGATPDELKKRRDDIDRSAKRRAKGLKNNNNNSNHSSNYASSSPPTSPQPHNTRPKKKRERGQFPNEKFGRPPSSASLPSSNSNTSNSNHRGLSNPFPNNKFGTTNSSGSRSATTRHGVPGAHSSTTTMIASAGRQSAPEYERVHLQMNNVEPTITIEPNTIDMGEEEPTIHVEPDKPEEYLVEASLVPMREEEEGDDAAEVLEAKEVTLMDVFQIKGVKCLLGSILGCFCIVLVALIVAIVMLTASSDSSASATLAPTSTPMPDAPPMPDSPPTDDTVGTAGYDPLDECLVDMDVVDDSPILPMENPIQVLASNTSTVTFTVSQTFSESTTRGNSNAMTSKAVFYVGDKEQLVCDQNYNVPAGTVVGTYTAMCDEEGVANVWIWIQDEAFSGYEVATPMECGDMEQHNVGYSFRLSCTCEEEYDDIFVDEFDGPMERPQGGNTPPPEFEEADTPPPQKEQTEPDTIDSTTPTDTTDILEPPLSELVPPTDPSSLPESTGLAPTESPTADYIPYEGDPPEGDAPFDDDLYTGAMEDETAAMAEESESSTNAIVVVVVVAAILVAIGMIAFVPLFLVYMQKKLQQEQQAKQAKANQKIKKQQAKGNPEEKV